MVTERKRKKFFVIKMVEESDLLICGHVRIHHQHLLGTNIKYPCLKCDCPKLEGNSSIKNTGLSHF